MEIYRSGVNYGQMPDPTLVGDKVNSVCGDKLTLQIKLNGDKVSDARFFGVACAVSKTSASILTEFIKGKTVREVKELTESQILELIKFDLTASRQQCALLCYYALREALKTYAKD